MNWEISPLDVGVVVRFDDEQIKGRDHQECHDAARRWLDDWAHSKHSVISNCV